MSQNKNISHTFRLLRKESNFLSSFASIFDFTSVDERFICDKTEEEADFKAMESDWKAVGIDIKETFKHIHV